MASSLLDAMSRLSARRFASFAEAATSVLDLVAGALPHGPILLGQVDWDMGECRVIDARRAPLARGTAIPLASDAPGLTSGAADLLDREALAGLGPGPWVAAPLDAADGSIVGLLLASGEDGEVGARQVAQLLLVASRLLSYEWESVSTRAELRRLSALARDRARTDDVTGLPDRAALLDALEREWELARRGTVETYLVVCDVRERSGVAERIGEAAADLLLKDVAEVLGGGVRRTDYLGRVSDDGLAAVLVGCKGVDGALAFLERFERAFERAADARPATISLSYGIHSLAEAGSAAEALEQAETAARSAPARVSGTPLGTVPGGGAA
jgi:diguanylate cyclase (GGDEF)-like protein